MLKTPFHSFHKQHDAKLVDFAGWEMPILYSSIHEEHHQVRNIGGLFDVSHMGRINITGRNARKFIERIVTRRITDMEENTCRYSLICNAQGGVMDDILVYRFAEHWMLVVNASNREKIMAHLKANIGDLSVKIDDQTTSTAMVALQGPKIMEHIGKFSKEVPTLKRYTFCQKNLLILKMTISRTGYTGEDGVEVILPASMASMALKLLVKDKPDENGNPSPTLPCGLGARDTLRMEAGMPLYGHELSEDIDPISAGLKFAVCMNKDELEQGEKFIGQDALKAIEANGPKQKIVGLKITGKRTARQGMNVNSEGNDIGVITSGCVSPTLGYPIAMALVNADKAEVGTTLQINIGSTTAEAQVVKLPFYKMSK